MCSFFGFPIYSTVLPTVVLDDKLGTYRLHLSSRPDKLMGTVIKRTSELCTNTGDVHAHSCVHAVLVERHGKSDAFFPWTSVESHAMLRGLSISGPHTCLPGRA
jgi:hypothetical protein